MNSLSPGTVIHGSQASYTIVRVLGQGGFGITYLVNATRKHPDGSVSTVQCALKEHFISELCSRDNQTLRVEYSAPVSHTVAGSLRAFLSEARRVQSLGINHPNIVKIYEVFQCNNTAYYAMEYLGDTSLEKYINARKSPLDEAKTMSLMKPVIEAVATLHENKVAHYDIKPANIMLTFNNTRAVIIDFGLAKHYDNKGNATSTITAAGLSRGYAPIEQYAGIKQFSPACDVYALGATLYFMLTAEQPPEPLDMKGINLGDKLKHVSPQLAGIIMRALEFNDFARYPSAREMLAAINGKGDDTVLINPDRRSKWPIGHIIAIIVSIPVILFAILVIVRSISSSDDDSDLTDTMAVTTADSVAVMPDVAAETAAPAQSIPERTESRDLDLCVSRDGHNYFFTEEEWFNLTDDEKSLYTKKGLVVKKGGRSFMLSLNYYPKMTWYEANRRFGNKLPAGGIDEVMMQNWKSINRAIKAFGGDVPSGENWFWSGDHNSHEHEGQIYDEVYVIDMTGQIGIEPESPEAKYYVRTVDRIPRGG